MIQRTHSLTAILAVGFLLMGFSASLWAQSPPPGNPPPQEIDNPPPTEATPDNPPPTEATLDNPPPAEVTPDDPPSGTAVDNPPPSDNHPPNLIVPDAQAVNEGLALTFTVTATDSDEGQLVTFSATDLPAGATFDADTGVFSWTPTLTQAGTYTVSFTATDNGAPPLSDGSQSVTITVNDVNRAPSFTKGGDQTVLEDASAQTVSNWGTGISAGPADEANQAVDFVVSNDNNGLFSVQPSVDASGNLTYTPATNANGSATVTVQIHDNGGTANGGVDTSPAQTFVIHVTPVNDAPTVAAIPDPGAILEDAGVQTISLSGIGAGAANESQTLTVTATSSNTALIPNPTVTYTSPGATGSLTYTPVANASGTAVITVTVKDNGGTANGGIDTVTRTFTVTVTPVNDAPSFTKGSDQTVNEDSGPKTVAGWASSISAGPADESGQGLNFIVTNDNNALFSAQPAVSSDGTLTFTPAANASGSATVTVKLRDSGGTASGGVDTSPSQTFTITVNPVNDAPSFVRGADQTVYSDAGPQAVVNWATSLSAGPANESGQTLNFLVTNDNNGLFSAQPAVDPTGTLTFTPSGSACGSATVTVRIHDNGGTANGGVDTSDPQTFTITVKDRIPPVVKTGLTWVKILDKDKDDDGKEDGEDYTGNAYKVSVSATDNCDPAPAITAFIPQPLTAGSAFAVKYEKGKKNAIEVHIEKKKTEVKLKGPNEQALRALLTQAIALSGFEVTDGQFVSLISKPLKKEDDRSNEAEYLFRLDGSLKLTSASGPGIKLVAFAVDASGNRSTTVEAFPVKPKERKGQALLAKVGESDIPAPEALPTAFGLDPNYPNPFNPATTIRYALPEGSSVSLVIYNILGQQVRVLVNARQMPGVYSVSWDSRDACGRGVASGLYFYRLQAGEFVAVRKMLLMK